MKNWKGKSLFGIGLLHTAFGVILIAPLVTGEILDEGIFGTINGQPKREAFLWFLFSGFLMLILGAVIDFMEKNDFRIPRFLGWSLLAATLFAVTFSPLSGGWLILIPAIGLILNK